MATSTQLAQALALKKQNPNLSTRDAVLQTKQATTPTPTGGATLPIAPTVTPPVQPTPQPTQTLPPQITPEQKQAISQPLSSQDQATIDRMTAEGRFGPVPPQQTQPLPPTPTSMPKQVKTEQPIDFNQGLGREQDINNNLNSFYSQGISSPEEIKKASGYDTADQNKKNIIDSFITAKAPNADALFSSISTRQVVPESVKLTPAYRQAQNRYNRVNMYSSMTPSQVSTAMDNGKIIEGSQTWEDLKIQNPKLAQDVQNLRIVNGSRTNLYTVNPDGTKTNNLQKTYEEQFMEDFSDLFKVQSVADIIAQVKTADVIEAETKANKYEDEMNALEADIAKIDKDVEAELKGSGATGSRARLEKSVRRDKLNNDLQALNKLYTTQANRANQLITQNATALQTQQQQQSARNQAIAGVMMEGYKNQMALNQNQALFDQKIAQQAQAMNDPVQAINTVIDEYAKQGIFASTSTQEHIARAKAFIANGGTLGQYISQMQKDFQAKDAYKAKFGTQKAPTIQNFGTSTAPDYRQYNQTTGQWESVGPTEIGSGGDLRYLAPKFPGQAWAKNNNPAGITWNANFDKGTGTAALLKQAGIQYSKGTARPANEGGNYVTFNTIEDGLKAQRIIMSQTYGNLTVGQMLAKWVGTSEGPNYAKQVATNAGIDVNVPVSSLSEDQLGKLQMAKIQKESPGLAKILMQGVEKGGTEDLKMQALSLVQGLGGTADERQAFADNVIKVAQRDNISLADAKKKLGYKSADDTEFAKARGAEYKTIKADTRDKLSNATTALTLLNSPQTAIGDVASIVGFLKTIDPASVARESEVDSVRNARGVIDSLSNQFAQLKEGTKLTDSQRTQLKDSIQTIVDAGNAKYNEYVTDTTKEFEDRGLDATVYIPKKEIEKAKPSNTPVSTSQNQYVKPAEQSFMTGVMSNGKPKSSYFQ